MHLKVDDSVDLKVDDLAVANEGAYKKLSEQEESLQNTTNYTKQSLAVCSLMKLQGIYQWFIYSVNLENLPFNCHKEEIDNRKNKSKRRHPGTKAYSHV